jgi:Mitochondrial carrier protein
MQACGTSSSATFYQTACKLYREEGGFLRFYKGSQAIVTGCLPGDAAFFSVYEIMRRQFNYHNQKFDFFQTASIGAVATIAHDFFIAPSDSKGNSY